MDHRMEIQIISLTYTLHNIFPNSTTERPTTTRYMRHTH
jgi:hypothetical protein